MSAGRCYGSIQDSTMLCISQATRTNRCLHIAELAFPVSDSNSSVKITVYYTVQENESTDTIQVVAKEKLSSSIDLQTSESAFSSSSLFVKGLPSLALAAPHSWNLKQLMR